MLGRLGGMVITGSSSISGYISMSCSERRNQQGWDPASGGGWEEHRGTQKPQDRERNQTSELYGRFHTAVFVFNSDPAAGSKHATWSCWATGEPVWHYARKFQHPCLTVGC